MISGWGLDSEGKKMSKRLGNFVDPLDVVKKYSADALRYWSAGATLGNNLRYNEQDVIDGNKLIVKLWNATRFISTYLFDEDGEPLPLSPGEPTLPDRWIVSRFMAAVKSSTDYLDNYEYSHALDVAEHFFFDEFCDNYLEIVKQRFWNPDQFPPEQVEAARFTLHSVLLGLIKLLAPFIPYITEELYQIVFRQFGGPVSIHISEWPVYDESLIDAEAEEAGRLLVSILTGVRRWKTSQQVHAYFPLSEMVITAGEEEKARIEPIADDLRAAAHAEVFEFGEGGNIPTEAENITLNLTLGEKKSRS